MTDSSPSPRSSIPVLKPAMSSSRIRSSSATTNPLNPPLPTIRTRPSVSLHPSTQPTSASPRSPSPRSPSPYGHSVKAEAAAKGKPPLQRRKPSLMIDRPGVRFSADPQSSASPPSAASPASTPSPVPFSPPSPSTPRDAPPSAELDLTGLSLPPPPRSSASRTQSVTLSASELSRLKEPLPHRRHEHSQSVSSFASNSSSGAETPQSVSSHGSTGMLSRPSTAGSGSGGSSENIRVIVRCRPTLPHEATRANARYLTFTSQGGLSVEYKAKQKAFNFDAVFPPATSQAALYQDAAAELIDAALQGYNGCIFAYGQTGSGKSHTMMGALDSDEEAGLIPRAIAHVFACIDREVEEARDARLHLQFSVSVSFLEIYNEKAGDLLVDARTDLEIRELEGTFFAPTLTRAEVASKEALLDLIRLGNERRNVAATSQNSRSSRSHTILTLYLEKRVGHKDDPEPSDAALFISSKINLVDLAGSERLSTSTKAKQGRETLSINLSLSCLSNCILCLTEGSVPTYRDSKLTRLLKDSLGGNSKTTMIACISAVESASSESVSTLRWAERAKRVRNQPIVNDGDKKDARLRELREEMEAMKRRMMGRNKDLIRMLWMVKQLSGGKDDEGGDHPHPRTGDVDLDLTEAILQDPFNHPMAAYVAREHAHDTSSPVAPVKTLPCSEEKEQDDETNHDGLEPLPLFLAPGGSFGPSPAASRPGSAAGKGMSAPGTMSRDFFRIFKETMRVVNQQIKSEVSEVPAFDEGGGGGASAPAAAKPRRSSRERRVSEKAQVLDEAGQVAAMKAAMEEAERERMREHEGRMYLDGVVADLQRQLQEAAQGKMDALMRCRCRELEGKAEALAMRVEEEVRGRQVVEEEKKQLWAAVEESERAHAEERKALEAAKADVDRLRARDKEREKAAEDEAAALVQSEELKRHDTAEAAAQHEQLLAQLMHLEEEKRTSEEAREAAEAQLAEAKARLSEAESHGQRHDERVVAERTKREDMWGELEKLKAEVDEWQRRAEAAEAAEERERKHRTEADHQLRTLQQEVAQQQAALESTSGAHTALQAELAAARRLGVEVREELASLKSYTAAQTVARETENRALKAAALDGRQKAEEAETRAEEARLSVEQLREALRAAQAEVQQLTELTAGLKAAGQKHTAEVFRLSSEAAQAMEAAQRGDQQRQAEKAEERRRVRRGLLELHGALVSAAAGVSAPSSPVGGPAAAVRGQEQTMRALSETLTHAQVRALMKAGTAPPLSAVESAVVDSAPEAAADDRPLEDLIASITRLHADAVARTAAVQRDLEAKRAEVEAALTSEGQQKSAASILQAQCAELQQRLAEQSETVTSLQTHSAQLQQQSAVMQGSSAQDADEASQKLLALEAQLSEERHRVAALHSEMSVHAASVAAMQERHEAALQVKDEEVERLREEQRLATESVDEWKTDLERLEDARSREVDLVHADVRQREGELVEMRAAMEAAAQEKAAERERREELETDVKVMTEEMQRRSQQMQSHIQALQTEHLQETAALEAQLTASEQQLTDRATEAAAMQSRLEEVQQAQEGKAQDLISALKLAAERVQELETETDALRGEKVATTERLHSAQDELQQLTASREAKQEEADDDLSRLQEFIAELLRSQREKEAAAEAATAQTSLLQQRTAADEDTIRSLQSRVAAMELQRSQQQGTTATQLEEWVLERTALKAQLNEKTQELTRLGDEHIAAHVQTTESMAQLQRSSAERCQQLTADHSALEARLKDTEAELTAARGHQQELLQAVAQHVAHEQQTSSGEAALHGQLSSMMAHIAQVTAQLQQSATQHATRVEELQYDSQRLTAEREQVTRERDALQLQVAELTSRLQSSESEAVPVDEEGREEMQRVRESEMAWREKAQRLSQLVMDNEEAVAQLRVSAQRNEDALSALRASHAQVEGEVSHLRSLLASKDSQLLLYEHRVLQQKQLLQRLQLQAVETESKAEAESSAERAATDVHPALDAFTAEWKAERSDSAALEDLAANAFALTRKRRTNDRALSMPTLPRMGQLPSALAGRGVDGADIASPGSHPLYEATEELRVCILALKTSYQDCVESKRALAQSAATEVEAMRDELREWRREEWDRVSAVDRVKRRMRRHDEGWHEAKAVERGNAPASGCSIM